MFETITERLVADWTIEKNQISKYKASIKKIQYTKLIMRFWTCMDWDWFVTGAELR